MPYLAESSFEVSGKLEFVMVPKASEQTSEKYVSLLILRRGVSFER